MQKKAIIAMSGGVDSSVAAYLMVKEGYDCAGATLKLYDNPQCSFPGHRACCTPSDTEDARSVAARLGMLYYVFPMHDEFRHSVIDKFADTYLHGGTPNPCIDCNRFLKFSALLDKARELGCEYIASGHYARREQDPETGRFILKKGLDPTKDQSYVLYAMTQDQLAHTLFPLGSYTKKRFVTLPRNRALSMQINRTVRISASYRTEIMLPLLNSIPDSLRNLVISWIKRATYSANTKVRFTIQSVSAAVLEFLHRNPSMYVANPWIPTRLSLAANRI